MYLVEGGIGKKLTKALYIIEPALLGISYDTFSMCFSYLTGFAFGVNFTLGLNPYAVIAVRAS